MDWSAQEKPSTGVTFHMKPGKPLRRTKSKRKTYMQRKAPNKTRAAPRRKNGLKAKPHKNPKLVTEYKHEIACCQVCGVQKHWLGLSFHHLIKLHRIDDKRNGLLACGVCHDRLEGTTVVVDAERLGPISFAEALWLKRERDPENWCPEYLDSIYPQVLPEPVRPKWL